MGKGFPVEKVPADAFDTMLIFATGSGISPIKALIDAGDLDATDRQNVTLYYGAHDANSMAFLSWCASPVPCGQPPMCMRKRHRDV